MSICTRNMGADRLGSNCPECGHVGVAHTTDPQSPGAPCLSCDVAAVRQELAELRTQVTLGPRPIG